MNKEQFNTTAKIDGTVFEAAIQHILDGLASGALPVQLATALLTVVDNQKNELVRVIYTEKKCGCK